MTFPPMRLATLRPTLVLSLQAALLAGCGGDEPATPPPPPTLAITGGAGQAGEAGSQLPQPIVAQLTNRQGPVAGTAVAFSVETGGGLVSRAQATTDATGSATVTWTLGGALGEQRLRVSAGGSTQSVAATATPGPPEIAAPVTGNGQFALVGRPVPIQPRVQVTDRFGNPVAGVAVVFTVLPGSGTIADSTGVTDAGGFVTLGRWTLSPTPGFNRLRALAAQAVGEFIAIGTPASVTAVGGQGQTVNVGTRGRSPPPWSPSTATASHCRG